MSMREGGVAQAASGIDLFAGVPRYDPLAPQPRDKALRRLVIASILLHLILLAVFWDSVLSTIRDEEDVVVVKMMEEEQQKPQRKVLQQRRIDTAVRRQLDVVQPEIVRQEPIVRLDQNRRVDLQQIDLADAPKVVEQRDVEIKKIDMFADKPVAVQPLKIDTHAPTVKRIATGRTSTGPKKLQAASPISTPRAADIEAPVLKDGVVSRNTVAGSLDGARIKSLKSGTSDQNLYGEGDRGTLGGVPKECEKDPICLAYLEMIRKRVYQRWHIPTDVDPGAVRLKFHIDRGGSAHGLQLVSTDDPHLGQTCVGAFRHASPFPPPPPEIQYLVNKSLIAKFSYGD